MDPFRVLSYGGGLDSFAMLLDAIERRELPALAIFADVGDPKGKDPAEWPGTYHHIREVVQPLCARMGIEFLWLDTTRSPVRGCRSLFAYFETRRILPTRLSRLCTAAAKIERIHAYIAERAAGRPVEMWIGFEAGEEERARRDPHAYGRGDASWVSRFPLLERGLCRCRCEALCRRLGYAVPRKSACVFCPFSSRADFQTLRRELPETFARVAAIEENCRPTKRGKILRYGYQRGDGTDPDLATWIAKPFRERPITCAVCGGPRATKRTGCASLEAA